MDVISQLHEENVRLEAENGRLVDENKRLIGQATAMAVELADARKAALSLYRALLYDDLSRNEIVANSLEKWPWLGISETGRAESSTNSGPEKRSDER